MNKFKGYIMGVLVVMALIIGLAWFLGGPECAKTFGPRDSAW